MKLGFAIITDKTFLENLTDTVNDIADEYGFFNKLGLEHNLPHTTLFQGEFPKDFDYHEVLRQIYAEMAKLNIDSLVFTNVEYIQGGWYFYMCDKTKELQQLHEYTLSLIESHVIADSKDLNSDIDGLPQEQIDGIKKYGYRYSGKVFMPHITLARTNDSRHNDIISTFSEKLKQLPSIVKIQCLTVYEMGENGTHKNTLDEMYIENVNDVQGE